MKIRTDFVTNSSSSSFCSIHISGSKLNEILKKYKNLFESEDLEYYDITISDEGFAYMDDEGGYYDGPADKSDMASSFIEFLRELADCCEDPDDFDELLEALEENEDEINKTITSLNWERCDTGWGGDSESRLWHNYDEDFIRRYMGLEANAEITKEIDEAFRDKVVDATSQETTTWSYDGKKLTITEDFDLI